MILKLRKVSPVRPYRESGQTEPDKWLGLGDADAPIYPTKTLCPPSPKWTKRTKWTGRAIGWK